MPCSPLIVPPSRPASANSSTAAACARAICAASPASTRKFACRLPSPAWPQLHASRPWRAPISGIASIASASRSSGTATSSPTLPPRCAVTAIAIPSRQRHSAAVSAGVSGVTSAFEELSDAVDDRC
jgi:hypothetical protein